MTQYPKNRTDEVFDFTRRLGNHISQGPHHYSVCVKPDQLIEPIRKLIFSPTFREDGIEFKGEQDGYYCFHVSSTYKTGRNINTSTRNLGTLINLLGFGAENIDIIVRPSKI